MSMSVCQKTLFTDTTVEFQITFISQNTIFLLIFFQLLKNVNSSLVAGCTTQAR